MENIKIILLLLGAGAALFLAFYLGGRNKNLNKIKAQEVGDGQHGKDRFATDADVKEYYKVVKLPEAFENLEGKIPQGRVVNFNEKTREAYIDTSYSHFQIEAPTESGKSTKYVIPNVQYNLMAGTTMIVPDTKKEIYNLTANTAKELGYEVYILDFTDPLHSHTFDYFEEVNKHAKDYLDNADIFSKSKVESYAGKLAKTVVGSRERSDTENTFFLTASEGVMHSLAILLAMFAKKTQKHFSSINSLIGEMMRIPKKPKDNQPVIIKLLNKFPQDFGAVKYFGPGFAATGETESNIYSSVLGDMKPFIESLSEQIIAMPGEDEYKFSFKNLLEKKSILYICIPEDEEQYFVFGSTIMQNLYNQLSHAARSYPGGKLPKRIYIPWEEMGLYPKVNQLPTMLAIARGKGILFDLIYQDANQIEEQYGEKGRKIISSQCATSIYLAVGPEDIDTGERISKALGTKTVKTGSVSVSHDSKNTGILSSGTSHSKTEQMMEKPLMSTSEVLHINQREITLLLKRDKHPYKCHLKGYYTKEWGLNQDLKVLDLHIEREAKNVDCMSLAELLNKIDEYVNSTLNAEQSYIKITKVPSAEREAQDAFQIISRKLTEITGDLIPIELLKQKNYVAFFKYMDQYSNKINRYELQTLIEPLAEEGN